MSVQVKKVSELISLISHPTRLDVIPLIQRIKSDQAVPIDPLVTMARAFLNTQLLKEQLTLYRRSKTDVNGYDFNWNDKRTGHNYNRTHSLNKYLTQFVTENHLYGISMPGNTLKSTHQAIPPRVVHARDNRAVLITLGWCQLQNCLDLQKVHSLIISNDVLKVYNWIFYFISLNEISRNKIKVYVYLIQQVILTY